jgi:hypothetical protein
MAEKIYLDYKGKELDELTEKERKFLDALQYQCTVMDDFLRPLSRSEIKMLCETCENDIQLEIALRAKKVA